MQNSEMVYRTEREGCSVISLAAPVRPGMYGALGAEKTAQAAAELFARNFHELYEMEENEVQYAVIICVKSALYELCEICRKDLPEFQSNLQLLAMDQKKNRMMAVHLGDGYIHSFTKGRRKVISFPRQGIGGRSRYTTSMYPAAPNLKVFRWENPEADEFQLVHGGRSISVYPEGG